jgi:2-dehydro-3-deoxyglucarate aldolase
MIKKNIVLERLRNNEPALGGWVMTNSVVAAEIMAQAGFQWVCVDAEHSQVTTETAVNMFRAIERYGAEPFVRISLNDEVEIKQFMDMGARGIIVPMIKSYEEVKRAISYIKYAPQGNRSFALPRCTGYGQWSAEYFERSNSETFFGIMIEHIDAVADLDQIFACKEIDAVFVGPYDLSGSMGIPGQFDHPDFKSTLDLIYKKAEDHGVTLGFHEVHPTKEKIQALLDRGLRFIACGLDTIFILEKSLEFTQLITNHSKQ